MATTDNNLQVVNSMTEEMLSSLKDSDGKIPSLANQLVMTDDENSENYYKAGKGIIIENGVISAYFEKLYDNKLTSNYDNIVVPSLSLNDGDILHIVFNGKISSSSDLFLKINDINSSYYFSGWASSHGSPTWDGSQNVSQFKIGTNNSSSNVLFSEITLQVISDRVVYNCIAGGSGTSTQAMRIFVGQNSSINSINKIEIYPNSGYIVSGSRLSIYREIGGA